MKKSKNKYLSYITDDHLLSCISSLHNSYLGAKKKIDKKSFYTNKIDTFKLIFDSKFNNEDEESLIKNEVLRQIDKSINNSIGTFHEQILGGIPNFEIGKQSGFDIKAKDNTLFADIKNKHNTMNSSSSESLFQKLAKFADTHKKSKCYWVQILAKNSFCELWKGEINGREYSHTRVYKISGDKFYELLTGQESALYDLYRILPTAISDYLKTVSQQENEASKNVLEELKDDITISKRTIIDQITFDNFSYYLGFKDL